MAEKLKKGTDSGVIKDPEGGPTVVHDAAGLVRKLNKNMKAAGIKKDPNEITTA